MDETTGTTPNATDATSWADAEPIEFGELMGTLWATLREWVDIGVRMLPNFVLAAMVVLFAFFAGRLASRLAGRALDRISQNRQVNYLATTAIRVIATLAGGFGALAILHLDGVVTSLLAGVGVVGLALGFAFQDIAANFMASVLLAVARPFRVGDLVKTSDFMGVVERTDLRTTHLRLLDGELAMVPNKDVFNNAVINLTENPHRRVEVAVGVGYDDDLREARRVITEALEDLEMRNSARPVQVILTGFGGSSIDMICRFWIETRAQGPWLEARSEAVMAIKDALDDAGLNIPFPIRTLDFGSKPVGGERLDDVLRPVFGEQTG